ncbi:hypothetical protein NDI76_02025 [Halogeometricum sp. S1BR25-6]|uniref:Uncharacterized protein n=1 Tax=Halogeometricum salsisoli TaxID=2950536 RepID=A0ABU2GBL6_9EURY|nr:hypothetical protein [Halogeometricum sp. S1BR25-6]MDS0297518.1 hypothetical protein [Halogeometricum sp. S1BR25-6]
MAVDKDNPFDEENPFDEDNPFEDVPVPEYTEEELGLPPVREEIRKNLNRKELELFKQWRLDFACWAYDRGKEPYFREGYSPNSMRDIINRVDRFCEWFYGKYSFTTKFSKSHLNEYWFELLQNDNQLSTNRRTVNNVALILKYQSIEWSIPKSEKIYKRINEQKKNSKFTDWNTPTELKRLKSASLKIHTVPSEESLSPEEAEEWAVHLSQRLGKPKYELRDEDWDGADSWLIPSLVYVSCDVGFRPNEIRESKMSWLNIEDPDDAFLSIPHTEDTKDGKNNWRCELSRDTVRVLNHWLEERAERSEYYCEDENGEKQEREEIWLNNRGNPYNKSTLRRSVMIPLQREAGIDVENRENGWYMIRRGVGTHIANESGISALMTQLRINRVETALRYVQTDTPGVRRWFNKR